MQRHVRAPRLLRRFHSSCRRISGGSAARLRCAKGAKVLSNVDRLEKCRETLSPRFIASTRPFRCFCSQRCPFLYRGVGQRLKRFREDTRRESRLSANLGAKTIVPRFLRATLYLGGLTFFYRCLKIWEKVKRTPARRFAHTFILTTPKNLSRLSQR